jgi:beta-carotene 15,15'-dioxygenase
LTAGLILREQSVRDLAVGERSLIHFYHRSFVIALFTLAVAAHMSMGAFDMLAWPALSAALILLLGAPHGALDVAVATRRHGLDTRRKIAGFLVRYVFLAGLVLGAWWLVPGLTLTLFLLISACHFGGDWGEKASITRRIVQGTALLTATAALHQAQVAAIFALLAPVTAADAIAASMHAVAPIALGCVGGLTLRSIRRAPAQGCEFFVVLAGAVLLPPITFFLIYFCLLHSVRHLLGSREELAHATAFEVARQALPYASTAIIGCCAGAALIAQGNVGSAILPAVFITLAALTVPHMLLVE